MAPRLNGDLQEAALTHEEQGPDQNALTLGFAGWQGRTVVSSPQAGGPAFLPPRELASHLAPFGRAAQIQVTAPRASSSVQHFLRAVEPGAEVLLLAQTVRLFRKLPSSPVSSPPHSCPACLLSPPFSSSTIFPLLPSFLSPLFIISLLDTFSIW